MSAIHCGNEVLTAVAWRVGCFLHFGFSPPLFLVETPLVIECYRLLGFLIRFCLTSLVSLRSQFWANIYICMIYGILQCQFNLMYVNMPSIGQLIPCFINKRKGRFIPPSLSKTFCSRFLCGRISTWCYSRWSSHLTMTYNNMFAPAT